MSRDLVNADSTSFPDARLLRWLNMYYQKAAMWILQAQDDTDFDDVNKTDYPIVTQALVANQRDYPIPLSEKVLEIKRVDLTYDGSNWYRAFPIDSSELAIAMPPSSASQSTLDSYFPQTNPRYDIKYNSIFIYPLASAANVASGATIKIEWTRQVTEFTSGDLTAGTAVPGFDDPLHPILAIGPAFEYAKAKNLPQAKALIGDLAEYKDLLTKHYGIKDRDRSLAMGAAYQNFR